MIVTKSVSRFGRNTADTLDVLNKLRALLVDVYFEAEGIHTRESGQDFLISLLEGYAQEENQANDYRIIKKFFISTWTRRWFTMEFS
ncbi:hypothetical protein JCM15765_24720 [Paradesulfitobacterium aromaticivorans]